MGPLGIKEPAEKVGVCLLGVMNAEHLEEVEFLT